ncbi:protease complex subunit PrcB family protein [uncultured Flavobacterium sp.]|uniref:protease complex subunit PrcB family protein n=1 Tax=uncultured Flavobacterium sp. TaxID=165435 RepID=UPI0030C894CB
MKNLIFSTLLLISITSCENDDDNIIEQVFTPQVITPVLIAQNTSGGPYYNFPNQEFTYFTNENDWEQFKTNYWIQSTIYPETIVDFTQHIPIICIDQTRPDSGYVININSIIEYQDSIVVETESLYGPGFQTPSRPFIAVKIPKTNKPIVFQ